MPQPVKIALAPGDGIGTEIMDACLRVFEAAGVTELIEFVPVDMGERVFAQGDSRGMSDEAMETIESSGCSTRARWGRRSGAAASRST
jgi:isocitrate dehydrogenase